MTDKYVIIQTNPSNADKFHMLGNLVTCVITLSNATMMRQDKTHYNNNCKKIELASFKIHPSNFSRLGVRKKYYSGKRFEKWSHPK